MPLSDLSLPFSLNTPEDDAAVSLFNPVLKEATTFDVAVGYFSAIWLRDTAEGMAHFAKNGGVSRWIVSPELSKNDMDALLEAQNLEGSNYFMDAFSRNKQIPKIGTVILAKSLIWLWVRKAESSTFLAVPVTFFAFRCPEALFS